MSSENGSTSAMPEFESIRKVNPYGEEYWLARELMPLLGYNKWERFEGVIKRAMTACEQVHQAVKHHFPTSGKMIPLGKGGQRQVTDYNLTRFACYLIAQNGEPSKPEIAAAQSYFALSTRKNELRELAEEQEDRIAQREQLIENNKALAEAAHRAGVISQDFPKFQKAGVESMYGGLDVKAVKARKGIPEKDDFADRMGRAELAANNFRVTTTEQKIVNEGIIGGAAATNAHREVGKLVRKTIKEAGATLPEDLTAEPNIKPLIKERQRSRKKVAAQKAAPQLAMFSETEQNAENASSSPYAQPESLNEPEE